MPIVGVIPLVVANTLAAFYALGAEIVAIAGIVEIGPNLLSAVTAVVGLLVLVVQVLVSRRVRSNSDDIHQVKKKIGADRRGDDSP